MKNLIILTLIISLLSGCKKKPAKSEFNKFDGWTLYYRNDSEGRTVFGNKQELIDAARMGFPIRIGFGNRRLNDSTKSVEHIADATFLTITNSNELFAQIQPIIGQRPNFEGDSMKITFRENINWTILVGTNGFSDRLSIDRFTDTIIGHRIRPTEISWFVNLPKTNEHKIQDVKPLWNK